MPTKSKPQKRAAWICGIILLIFILCVFVFGPPDLAHWKKQLLKYIVAFTLSLLFYLFIPFPGSILLEIEKRFPRLGKINFKAAGTFALFISILISWEYQDKQGYEKLREQEKPKIEKSFEDVKPPVTKDDIEKLLSAENRAKYAKLNEEYEEIQRLAKKKYNKELELSIPTKIAVVSGLLYRGDYAKAVMGSRTIHLKNPDNINAINLLGLSLLKHTKYDEAEQKFKEAIAIDEEKLGPNHPNVAFHLINLGDVLIAQDRKEEAGPKYLRALKIFEEHYGMDHPMAKLVRKRLDGLQE